MADPTIRVKRSTVQGKTPTNEQLGLGEIAINHYDGKIFIRQDTGGVGIGTTVVEVGGNQWKIKTSNYTAVSNDHIIADTSGGSFTITLPASPSTGHNILIADGDDWSTNNLTVARNGSTIEGSADDLILDISNIIVTLIYDGATWQIFSQVGPKGDPGTSYFEKTIVGIHTLSNVGIGTTNPTSKLVVQGDVKVTGIVTAATFSGDVALSDGSVSAPSIKFSSSTTTGIYSPGANQFGIATNGVGRITIDASGNVVAGGTLTAGSFIPTSSTVPTNGLYSPGTNQLALSTNGTGRLFIGDDGRVGIGGTGIGASVFTARAATNQNITIKSSSGEVAFEAINDANNANVPLRYLASQYVFNTGATERLRITSAGLLGLGTSSPGQQMVVRGSQPFLEIRDSRQSTWDSGDVFSGILFGTDDSSASVDPHAFIKAVHTRAGTGHTSADAGLTFGTSASTSTPATERMRLTYDGKLGIGTTSPGQALDVVGAINSQNNAAAIVHYQAQDTGAATDEKTWRVAQTSRTNKSLLLGVSVNDAANTAYAPISITRSGVSLDSIQFATGSGAERARIDSSGRLLVGTSSARNLGNIGTSKFVIEGTGYNSSSVAFVNNENSPQPPYLILGKSRGGSVGSSTVVQSGDSIGQIVFAGADGTDLDSRAAEILCAVDGTPGANDMPGRLMFSTTADGSATPTERMRIDSSGRLLVGTSSAETNYRISTINYTPTVQIKGAFPGGSLALTNTNGNGALWLTNAATQSAANSDLGIISFNGYDGTNYLAGARIQALTDGTCGANDLPTRLVFSVTADGSASPSEAMRINNAGELLVGYTSDNGAYKLQVNSQIFATSAIIATSDGRYKENVATLDGCVDLVKALRPVSFDWKEQQDITRVDDDGNEVLVREGHNFPSGTQVGFIAQEVAGVLADKPWLGSVIKQNVRPAVTDNDGNELAPEEEFLGIAEGNLIAVLTSALQEAIGEIESLKARVAALEPKP